MAKRICTLGLLTALCMVLGYLERLVSLSFIAPGIRLGLANSAALLLICYNDKKGALAVNLCRIILSALLFGSLVSFAFSFVAGLGSSLAMILLSRLKNTGVLGISIAGGFVHNLLQAVVAMVLIGNAVLYYLPLLLLCGAVSGGVIGAVCYLISKKIKTNIKI